MPDHKDEVDPAAHWESRYADTERVWSGRVNATTAEVIEGFTPGDALELGCGEGGDALWLAGRGWRVTAIDLSPTAVARGAAEAERRGVADRIEWAATDLSAWQPTGGYDLATASFFHSEVALERTAILRRAAASLRPGGHLVVVSHVFESDADIPPWSRRHAHEHAGDDDQGHGHRDLLTPEREIAELDLDTDWQVIRAEVRPRQATGPDGEQAIVKDGVVVIRRLP